MNTQLLAAKIAAAIPALAQDCVLNNETIIKQWLDEEVERDRVEAQPQTPPPPEGPVRGLRGIPEGPVHGLRGMDEFYD